MVCCCLDSCNVIVKQEANLELEKRKSIGASALDPLPRNSAGTKPGTRLCSSSEQLLLAEIWIRIQACKVRQTKQSQVNLSPARKVYAGQAEGVHPHHALLTCMFNTFLNPRDSTPILPNSCTNFSPSSS